MVKPKYYLDVLDTTDNTERTNLSPKKCEDHIGLDSHYFLRHIRPITKANSTASRKKRKKFLVFLNFIVKLSITKDPWPTLTDTKNTYTYVQGPNTKSIQIKDLLTNEIQTFASVKLASGVLGMRSALLCQILKRPDRPYKQKLFRYTSDAPWAEKTATTVPEKTIKHTRGYYISVTCGNETKAYDSIADVSRAYGLGYPMLYYQLKRKKYYKNDTTSVTVVKQLELTL